jgi:nucleotide-binding universal stress UspA family protein
MKLLICTDGSSVSIKIADLVINLKFHANTHVTVLGVSENSKDLENLHAAMDLIDQKLGSIYQVDRIIRNGEPIEEIISEALQNSYDLVAVAGGGGQMGLLHQKLGSTTKKLARKLHTHFLVARNVPKKVEKVLFCTGSEAPGSMTMKLGGEWISNSEAQISLLHVLPQKVGELQSSKKQPDMNTNDTEEQQDMILTQANQQLKDAGVKNEIVFRNRQGSVVEEILNELVVGKYELLVVGAHYQPGHDRWQGTLFDDVTDQLLNRSTCSVLII